MIATIRWQPCVSHRPDEIENFVTSYFGGLKSKLLLIAGAGFDPRATSVARLLAKCGDLPDGLFIKEERPNPDPELVRRARSNLDLLSPCVQQARLLQVDVFASDGAVVGGRSVLRELDAIDLKPYSDTGSIIFADENDPLGLYRTILRIDDERRLAFEALGGSLLILSPLGSKMLAIGALMAALERDLPVYYVEARGYDVDWKTAPNADLKSSSIRHVWLAGDVYV